jgi:hypothetical protein
MNFQQNLNKWKKSIDMPSVEAICHVFVITVEGFLDKYPPALQLPNHVMLDEHSVVYFHNFLPKPM